MNRDEKIFLLANILESIRNNWAWGVQERLDDAIELANELGFKEASDCINEYIEEDYEDGRYFRDCGYGYYYLYELTSINRDDLISEELSKELENLNKEYC